MEEVFSRDVQQGLEEARISRLRRRSRLRIDLDGRIIPVLDLGRTGFVVAREDAPSLRGLVDLYDGATHLFQCLIVASEEAGSEMHYEFKRATAISEKVPLDFEMAENAPIALLPRRR